VISSVWLVTRDIGKARKRSQTEAQAQLLRGYRQELLTVASGGDTTPLRHHNGPETARSETPSHPIRGAGTPVPCGFCRRASPVVVGRRPALPALQAGGHRFDPRTLHVPQTRTETRITSLELGIALTSRRQLDARMIGARRDGRPHDAGELEHGDAGGERLHREGVPERVERVR
jgi:hypothetical protein